MILIGIDPGKSGGIAWLAGTDSFAVKMPETEKDICGIFKSLCISPDTKCVIERVHSMPGQGVKSMFTFGQNYGFLRGCLISLEIPFDEVTPQAWQKSLGCLTKGDKGVSKARAQQLYPNKVVTHMISDALLILEYLRRRELGQHQA